MSDQWRFLYRARFVRVIDADTIEMTLDFGLGVTITRDIRVRDLWCPETRDPGGFEASVAAPLWFVVAQDNTTLSWPFMVELLKRPRAGDETRSFTRYVGDIYDENLNSFATWMIDNGYGTPTR